MFRLVLCLTFIFLLATVGNETSTNPVASIFAWTRGLAFRAKLDKNESLNKFCSSLEAACVQSIGDEGIMTKDLALAIHGKDMKREHWVTTTVYLDHVNVSATQSTGGTLNGPTETDLPLLCCLPSQKLLREKLTAAKL